MAKRGSEYFNLRAAVIATDVGRRSPACVAAHPLGEGRLTIGRRLPTCPTAIILGSGAQSPGIDFQSIVP